MIDTRLKTACEVTEDSPLPQRKAVRNDIKPYDYQVNDPRNKKSKAGNSSSVFNPTVTTPKGSVSRIFLLSKLIFSFPCRILATEGKREQIKGSRTRFRQIRNLRVTNTKLVS